MSYESLGTERKRTILSNRLKALREAKGWNQTRLGKKIGGVAQRTICSWEQKTSYPNAEMLPKVQGFLKTVDNPVAAELPAQRAAAFTKKKDKTFDCKTEKKACQCKGRPQSIEDHKNMLKSGFTAVEKVPLPSLVQVKADGSVKSYPMPKHAQEPLNVRQMRTLTDEDDGGLLQNAAKELRRLGRLGEEGKNSGSPTGYGVTISFGDMTIAGPAEQMVEFCKETGILAGRNKD